MRFCTDCMHASGRKCEMHLGSDCLDNGLDVLVGVSGAAGHKRRACGNCRIVNHDQSVSPDLQRKYWPPTCFACSEYLQSYQASWEKGRLTSCMWFESRMRTGWHAGAEHTIAGSLLSSRDSHAYVHEALFLYPLDASLCVLIPVMHACASAEHHTVHLDTESKDTLIQNAITLFMLFGECCEVGR